MFDAPVTVALKDCVAPARTLATVGKMLTVTLEPEEEVLEFEPDELFTVPVQPASAATSSMIATKSRC